MLFLEGKGQDRYEKGIVDWKYNSYVNKSYILASYWEGLVTLGILEIGLGDVFNDDSQLISRHKHVHW